MVIKTSENFDKEFKKLSKEHQNLSQKKLELFLTHSTHPSLRIKKVQGYHEEPPILELSINMSIRMTFQHFEDFIYLRHVGTHQIFRKP